MQGKAKEILEIRNFLSIKEAELYLGDVNVFIGEQASGKSIILKLLYFFNNAISRYIISTIEKQESVRDYNKRIKDSFVKYFNLSKSDIKKGMKISYKLLEGDKDINFSISVASSGNINIRASDDVKNIIRKLKAKYKELKKIHEKDKFSFFDFKLLENLFKYVSSNEEFVGVFRSGIFIPASRSFFSIIESNILSLLRENIDIDVFMKEFGGRYEVAKRIYMDKKFHGKTFSEFDIKSKEIVKGRLVFRKDEEYIDTDDFIVKLSNASSGQQEVLPMLLVLSVFSEVKFSGEEKKAFYIEEPEAHIFPSSQRDIINYIIRMCKKFNNKSYLTTHSPYIVSQINNIILYNEVKSRIPEKEMVKFMDMPNILKKDIFVYSIDGRGGIKNIVDYNEGVAEANLLDDVAVETDSMYSELLEYI